MNSLIKIADKVLSGIGKFIALVGVVVFKTCSNHLVIAPIVHYLEESLIILMLRKDSFVLVKVEIFRELLLIGGRHFHVLTAQEHYLQLLLAALRC